MTENEIRELREHMRQSLAGWVEPRGALIPTDPDVESRAVTRIELRATIDTLTRVLGEPVDTQATANANHRDRMRIVDNAREEAEE